MVFASAFFAFLIGLPIGIILAVTTSKTIYRILGAIVNIGRSIPFAILMIALIPFTRFIVGTSIGTTASIVPLTIAAAPFIARLIETALRAVDKELVEAATVMGASRSEIIRKVLLPEALPSLISALTLTVVSLIGYSAMAGLVGGGGLGKVAIQYGYQRFNSLLMVETIVILVIFVEVVEWIGKKIVKGIYRKRGKGL